MMSSLSECLLKLTPALAQFQLRLQIIKQKASSKASAELQANACVICSTLLSTSALQQWICHNNSTRQHEQGCWTALPGTVTANLQLLGYYQSAKVICFMADTCADGSRLTHEAHCSSTLPGGTRRMTLMLGN